MFEIKGIIYDCVLPEKVLGDSDVENTNRF
jgi:hypothetical protein